VTLQLFEPTMARELRRRAAAVWEGAARDGRHGWQRSAADPAALLAVFDALHLKPGFQLCAYQYMEGDDGQGMIWAVPVGQVNQTCPDPGLSTNPPRPAGALDDLLTAITGNGSALSYLSASLFAREALEFGAYGHGAAWSAYQIMSAAPGTGDGFDRPGGEEADWEWAASPPGSWAPVVAMAADQVTVTFYTFCGLGSQRIIRHLDVYTPGEYRFVTREDVIARGPQGYVW
jgi:hypothetical protein